MVAELINSNNTFFDNKNNMTKTLKDSSFMTIGYFHKEQDL